MTTDFCGKDVEYILALSYGKDSLACLGAVEQLGLRIDRIIHAEIWATDTISADLPPMVEFKAKADKIIKERYGITVEHVCAVNIDGVKGDKVTFNDGFYHKVNQGKFVGSIKGFPMQQGQWCQKLKLSAIKTAEDIFYSKRKRGNRAGEIIGFPMIGACDLQTALKVEPIRKLQKNCISYIGIASDEPQRIKSDDTVVSQNILKRVENNADKTPSSPTETNETAVHNAFQKLKENHDFSPEVLKLLERVEKLIAGNDLDNFNSKIFEVPLFQQTYGSVSRVNEKLFGGDLRSVIDEVNGYIADEKNAEMNSTDIEAKPEQMSLFGSSPRRVSSDEIPRDRIDETKEAADVPMEDIKLKTVVIDLTPKEEYNREQPKEEKTEKENNDFSGYVISEDDFGEAGGAKSRYAANVEAIKTLKNIEAENRTAAPDEQKILAGYTGWGAIPICTNLI